MPNHESNFWFRNYGQYKCCLFSRCLQCKIIGEDNYFAWFKLSEGDSIKNKMEKS